MRTERLRIQGIKRPGRFCDESPMATCPEKEIVITAVSVEWEHAGKGTVGIRC